MYVPHERVSSSLGLVCTIASVLTLIAVLRLRVWGLAGGTWCLQHFPLLLVCDMYFPPRAPSPLRLKTLGTLSSCAHLALPFLPVRIHSYYTTFQSAVGAVANLGVGVAALDDKALDDPVEGLRHTRGRQGVWE
jgi:hypothetical protein